MHAGMQFRYKNPGGHIRAGAVKGVLGRLITEALPLGGASTACALEIAAGSKLYQVRKALTPVYFMAK